MNYNRELFRLTDDEKYKLSLKIDIYNNFMDMFGRHVSINQTILDPFTCKEVLSDEIKPLIISITKRRNFSIRHLMSDRLRIEEFKSKYTKDELLDVMCRIVELQYEIGERVDYSGEKIIEHSQIEDILEFAANYLNKDNLENMFFKLCDSGILKKFYPHNTSETVNKILDSVIAKSNISDPDGLIERIEINFPKFRNYPLIVLNENVNRDSRIKILKKKYRQKDLPSYIGIIKNEMTNLNSLDDFIEATVIQNNRVKEKEDGVMAIFKYVFVPGESYYRRSSNSYNNGTIKSVKEFSEKYKSYFLNRDFVRKFASAAVNLSNNKWYREENFKRLLTDIILTACTFDEKLEVISNASNYVEIQHILENTISRAYDADDIGSVKKFLLLLIEDCKAGRKNWSTISNFKYFEKFRMHDELSDIIENDFINNIVIYNGRNSNNISSDITGIVVDVVQSVKGYNSYFRRKVLRPEDIIFGGLNYGSLVDNTKTNLKSSLSFDTGDVVDTLNKYLSRIKVILEGDTFKLTDLIEKESVDCFVNQFIMPFKNLSEMIPNITESILDFDTTGINSIKNTSRYVWSSSKAVKTSGVLMENIELIFDILNELHKSERNFISEEDYNEIYENLDNTISNTKLLLAL